MDEHQHAGHHAHGCFFCQVAEPQMRAFMDHLVPQGSREHFRNARIEMLKGWRSFLDAKIDHLSKQSAAKGTTVPVD